MNENDTTTDHVKTGRIKFLLIVSIAVIPIVIAYTMYFYVRDWAPSETINEGELILPPVQITDIIDRSANQVPTGKWAILIPSESHCSDSCQQLLFLSRQVHTGLGKDATRVNRYLLVAGSEVSATTGAIIRRDYPDLHIRYIEKSRLEAVLGPVVGQPFDGNHLFLMDPNGNIMMFYTTELAGKPMLKDLKHLLRISNIG
ncbi:MAG: hypothetical protein HUJ31_13590 [Pseudomonadales bacterium]|nr:hypothetical protein [Pseudomonadales bacterium]